MHHARHAPHGGAAGQHHAVQAGPAEGRPALDVRHVRHPEHLREGLFAEEFTAEERGQEAVQVGHGGDHLARGAVDGRTVLGDVQAVLVPAQVRCGQGGVGAGQRGGVQPERPQDALLDLLRVAASADPLDEHAEDDVVGAGDLLGRAGGEVERLPQRPGEQLLGRERVEAVAQEPGRVVVADVALVGQAAGVVEEPAGGDGCRQQAGQVPVDGFVEVQETVLGHGEDGRGEEGLGHPADPEPVLVPGRFAGGDIGDPGRGRPRPRRSLGVYEHGRGLAVRALPHGPAQPPGRPLTHGRPPARPARRCRSPRRRSPHRCRARRPHAVRRRRRRCSRACRSRSWSARSGPPRCRRG